MYILLISRGIPSKNFPQWGCFEKDQAEALAAIGHKVIVMSVDARFKKKRGSLGLHHFNKNGVEYYNYIVLPGNLFIKTIGMDKYIKWIKFPMYFEKVFKRIVKDHGIPDIIYTQFYWNTVMGVKLKELTGIPVVGIEHWSRFNEPQLSEQEFKWESYAFEKTDTNIAVSKTLAENLQKKFNTNFEVIYNMFGKEFEDDYIIPQYDNSHPIRFISVGSLIKRKGFDSLIEAFSKSNLPSSLWSLGIIGGGEEEANLHNLIKRKGLDNNIKLLGEMDKVSIVEELKKSNIFVLPSRNENFSVAILEGLALGLPVLATDCGGIRECLTEENGIIVPVDDIKSISNGIKYMVANYFIYDRDRIRINARKRFSPKAIATQLTEIFNTILNPKSGV